MDTLKGKNVLLGAVITGSLLFAGFWTLSLGGKPSSTQFSIPPEKVAAYVHAIIEADRTIYATKIVDRMQKMGIVNADEHWEQTNSLLLPAQFLQFSGSLVARKGSGIRFRLISLWPIYERNAPASAFEEKGLQSVAKHPNRPYTGVVKSGKSRYFQAIYADKAIAKTCVTCHNTHPLSPRRDFKLNEVMGGIVITIPLDK
ncbi:MAG: DUF3365 domain-containing protein [Nitrospirae bacterium]|nr:DUF3365 domain-containing protein [Nitrospirota bacterium]